MRKEKKIMASAAAYFGSLIIALLASGTGSDKLWWFLELSVFCLVVIWTIL
jgi:hypothetical protein